MSDFLFDLPAVTVPLCSERKEKCKNCQHIQRWRNEYVSESHQVNFYCGIQKSGRTNNGLLKVKCKNAACEYFIHLPKKV
jgi:hypothetical protein